MVHVMSRQGQCDGNGEEEGSTWEGDIRGRVKKKKHAAFFVCCLVEGF